MFKIAALMLCLLLSIFSRQLFDPERLGFFGYLIGTYIPFLTIPIALILLWSIMSDDD